VNPETGVKEREFWASVDERISAAISSGVARPFFATVAEVAPGGVAGTVRLSWSGDKPGTIRPASGVIGPMPAVDEVVYCLGQGGGAVVITGGSDSGGGGTMTDAQVRDALLYPVNNFNGGTLATSYDPGYSLMLVTGTSFGWPTAATYLVETMRQDTGSVVFARQRASSGVSSPVYTRYYSGGAWTSWVLEAASSTIDGVSNPGGDINFVAGANMTITPNDTTNAITFAASGGVTDHGALTGLSDDDHPHYHTDARGDARYAPIAHVGTGGTAHANAVAAGAAGFMAGADKQKLDGIEAGATADQTAAEILTAVKTVDGAGSGLDADTLDGVDSAGFAAASHNHDATYVNEGDFTWTNLAGKPGTFAPAAHAASHQPGGGDAMAVDASATTGSLRTLGTGATQAAAGNHTHAGGGGESPDWMNQTGANARFSTWGDGSLHLVNRLLDSGLSPTRANIGNTVAVGVLFRLPKPLSLANLYVPCVGAVASSLLLGIYERSTGNRIWNPAAQSTVANAWLNVTSGLPVTLQADTDYWIFYAGNNAAGTTAMIRTPNNPFGSWIYGDTSADPLGNAFGLGIPIQVQMTLASAGVLPATIPASGANAIAAMAQTNRGGLLAVMKGTAS
jgi:hypothetical protein